VLNIAQQSLLLTALGFNSNCLKSNVVSSAVPLNRLLQILEDAPVLSAPLIDGAFALLRFIPPYLLLELTAHATTKIAIASALTPPPSTTSSTEKLLHAHTALGSDDRTGKGGMSTAEEALSAVSLSCSSGSSKSGNISVATTQSTEAFSLAPTAKLV
jgi:hypothetical protein